MRKMLYKVSKVSTKVFVFLFFIMTTQLFYAPTVFASTQNEVSSHHMHIEVNRNGSIKVHEFKTFNNANNPISEIDLFIDVTRASQFSVDQVYIISATEGSQGAEETEVIPLDPVESMSVGQVGVFSTRVIRDENNSLLQISLRPLVSQNTITVGFRYTLMDFVYKYSDTALMQWGTAVSDNVTITGDLTVDLTFEQQGTSEEIYIYANALRPIETVVGDVESNISISNINPSDKLDFIALFPLERVFEGRKIINNDVKAEFIALGNTWIERAETLESERRAENQRIVLIGVLIVALSIGVAFLFYYFYIRKLPKAVLTKQQIDKLENQSKIPDHTYSPAELSALINRWRFSSFDLIATLMDMVVKGYLLLSIDRKGEDGILVLSFAHDLNIGRLEPHEEYLINWLFNDYGYENVLAINEIVDITNHDLKKDKFLSKYETWNRIVHRQALRWNFDKSQKGKSNKLSDYGMDQYVHWMSFKKFLKSGKYKVDDLTLADWERFFVFSIILGEYKTVLDVISRTFDVRDFDDNKLTIFRQENFKHIRSWFEIAWDYD